MVAILVLGVGIVAAGTPARGVVVADVSEVLNRNVAIVDPSTLPPIEVGQDVLDFDPLLDSAGMQPIVVTLSQNLELENQALLRHDASLLTEVDHGDRLDEMRGRLHDAIASGTVTISHFRIEAIHVSLLLPFGQQSGLSLGLASRGTVVEQTYDASGQLRSSRTKPFSLTFVVRRALGARWLNVAVLPPKSSG